MPRLPLVFSGFLVLATNTVKVPGAAPTLSDSERAKIMERVQKLQKELGRKDEDAPKPALPASIDEADRAKILEKVAQLRKEFERQRREITAAALAKYESAASSEGAAVEFYLACQKIVQDRTPDLDPSNDKDEAKAEQNKVRQQVAAYEAAPGKAAALQIVLEHLVLTLQAPTYKDQGTLVSKVRDMVAKAMNTVKTYASPTVDPIKKVAPPPPKGGGKGKSAKPAQVTSSYRNKEEDRARRQIIQTMKQGGMGSIFAQAYNLANYFKPLSGWSGSPLDLESIYVGYVLPWYHENKPADLNQVWDEYVGHQLALHRCEQSDDNFAEWGITGYKQLLWNKWMDLLQHGTKHAYALDELVKLVKENLANPAVEQWVSDLSNLAESIAPMPRQEPVAGVPDPAGAEANK